MKEALCIQAKPVNAHLKRDSGYELPDRWIAFNIKLKGDALVGAPSARTTLYIITRQNHKSHAFRAACESRDEFHFHIEDKLCS